MRIIALDQIKSALSSVDLIAEIERGFIAYSAGESVVPPVGELILHDPPGDVHIKYGYLKGDDYYVIKIASGFYENVAAGLPSSNGLMLMFSQQTGQPVAALLDEGYLTDIRTAVAGAIAAKHLAPEVVTRIGIAGTGAQARLQLEYLKPVVTCREAAIWGRDRQRTEAFKDIAESMGFAVTICGEPDALLQTCNLIVTTTPAEIPLLSNVDALTAGTHITAMGSDTSAKQELASALLSRAEVVVADSIPQCLERGEIHQAIKAGAMRESDIVELGNIVAGRVAGRVSQQQITIADLTGVAVQDIQIAKAVYSALQ